LFAIDDTKDADTMDNRKQEVKLKTNKKNTIDKIKKFEEMLKKNDPKTKEEFQKIQALFVKQYKGE